MVWPLRTSPTLVFHNLGPAGGCHGLSQWSFSGPWSGIWTWPERVSAGTERPTSPNVHTSTQLWEFGQVT